MFAILVFEWDPIFFLELISSSPIDLKVKQLLILKIILSYNECFEECKIN